MNFQEYIFNLYWRIKDLQATTPWLLELSLVAMGLVILIIGLLIRRRRAPVDVQATRWVGRGRYEFRLCIIGNKHRWIKTRGNSLRFKFDVSSQNPMDVLLGEDVTSYEIDPRVLYEVDPSTIQKISWTLRGVRSVFIVVFREGEATPIQYQAPKRSAYILKTVEESNALSNALKKEFAKDFSIKTFFMYMVLLIVAIIAYLLLTGKISI